MCDASSARMRGHAFWTSEDELVATFRLRSSSCCGHVGGHSASTRQPGLVSSWYILLAARELLVRFARKAVDCAVLSLWMTLVEECSSSSVPTPRDQVRIQCWLARRQSERRDGREVGRRA